MKPNSSQAPNPSPTRTGPYENVSYRGIDYNPAGQITNLEITSGFYQWRQNSIEAPEIPDGFTANGLNQYSQISMNGDAVSIDHDDRGNITKLGTRKYTYDALNRLNEVRDVANSNALLAATRYDAANRLGRIVIPTSTAPISNRYVYDGADIIAEIDEADNQTLRRYVHGLGTDNPITCEGITQACAPGASNTEKLWLLSDIRGSLTTYVGEEAIEGGHIAIVGNDRRNRYDAFGLMSTNNNESLFAYTGQIYLPNTNLYHYKARAYNPSIGRFMQTDPIGYEDGTNLYAYVGNDPVNLIDPTGLEGQMSDAQLRRQITATQRNAAAALARFEARRSNIESVQNMVSDNGDTLLLVAPATMAIQAPISGAIAANSARTVATATGSRTAGTVAGELMSTVSELALTVAGAGIPVNDDPGRTTFGPDIRQIIDRDPLAGTTARVGQPDPIASDPSGRPLPTRGAISPPTNPRTRSQRALDIVRGLARLFEPPS